jgi:hypothetical protein
MGPQLWLSLGLLAGTTRFDSRLADYQWDITPRLDWGAEALAGTGPFAAGVRLWRSGSEQTVDPDATEQPSVSVTTLEFVGRRRIAELWGARVSCDVSGGWLRVAYDPDRVTIDAGGTPVEVELKAVDTWSAGAGLGVERGLGGGWTAGFQASHRWFELETAHRDGSTIENRTETFGDWTARVALCRRWGRS